MAMNEYIRKMREMKNISQENAAKELGYTRQTYIQIENGSRDITLSELKKLSTVFDIPFNKSLEQAIASAAIDCIKTCPTGALAKYSGEDNFDMLD